MRDVAQEALRRLLSAAESAHARGGASRKVTLPLTGASFPAYLELGRAEEKQAVNMAFLAAERAGAVQVDWDERAGHRSHAVRLVLMDAEVLAGHLQAEPRWSAVKRAEQLLKPLKDEFPVVEVLLERWTRGVKVRGTSALDVVDWVDAARVLQYAKAITGQDIAVRRASAHLFRNSKRIQDLWRFIEVLATGSVQPTQRDMEEVFADVGLVRFPPTLLLAGDGAVQCRNSLVPLVRPYIGIPPVQLQVPRFAPAPHLVLTVENLTTFHELAASRPQGAVLLYTGGMPSRSWTASYREVLRAVPRNCPVVHWGDIDAGGFRIAAHLAETCHQESHCLRLHAMTWRLPTNADVGRRFQSGEVRQIEEICARWGWEREGEAIGAATHPVEQEELPALWPAEADVKKEVPHD